jgi:hypothetical protein
MSDPDSHGRLADAAGPNDCDETTGRQLLSYGANNFVSSDHARETRRQPVTIFRRRGIGRYRLNVGYLSYEAVTPPRHVCHIASSVFPVADRLAQGGNMESKAAFVDRGVRPDPRYQVLLAYNLTWLLDEDEEDI